MKYDCAVIQDLLPLYIDGICSEESRKIIEEHLNECTSCKTMLAEMGSPADDADKQKKAQADLYMADMLKKIKKRINGRMARILLGAVAAAAVISGGVFILFSEPLKELGPEDVEMSAEIYDLQELTMETAGQTSYEDGPTAILTSPEDESELIDVQVPGMGRITMSEDTIVENPRLSVITTGSKYHLRIVHWDVEDDTLYVSKITTTLLGNEAKDGYEVSVSIGFDVFDRIVYRPESGGEEVLLWSKDQ